MVTPLDETVKWMQEYEVNFQGALEMDDKRNTPCRYTGKKTRSTRLIRILSFRS